MNYGQFIKLFCLAVALGIGFLSFSSYAQEASQDPQYSSYLKAIERSRQKDTTAKSQEPAKISDQSLNKTAVERICLENGSCMKKDFSDRPSAKHLLEKCKAYSEEYAKNESSLTTDAQICTSFLLGFSRALVISSYVSLERDAVDRDMIDYKKCPGVPPALYPEEYVRFMEQNPQLIDKNAYYGVYLFFQSLFECKLVGEK